MTNLFVTAGEGVGRAVELVNNVLLPANTELSDVECDGLEHNMLEALAGVIHKFIMLCKGEIVIEQAEVDEPLNMTKCSRRPRSTW